MCASSEFTISNSIEIADLWSGIGGHFDSLGQIINEFIDNAISNFEANSTETRNIIISLQEIALNGDVKVTIEDSGTGIKDINAAFSMGSRAAAETPLNEHGFGIKHALASANPRNDNWAIYTRTEDNYKKNEFVKIAAPYIIPDLKGAKENGTWPGVINGTGTLVQFSCARNLFKTIGQGIPGGPTLFRTVCDILCEDIGFIYAGIIRDNRASITLNVTSFGEETERHPVGMLEPDWECFINDKAPGSGSTEIDLGAGKVTVNYHFGFIRGRGARRPYDNFTSRKYYRQSQSSSGVEIRINGRILAYNIFKELWNTEKHNSYNSLLVVIDMKSSDISRLPQTRTSKNGFRQGDPKLEKLYEWIRKKMPDPKKRIEHSTDEVELFQELRDLRLKILQTADPSAVIQNELRVFQATGDNNDLVRVDMYECVNENITIYEGKVERTTSKDVYQLRMYWDGLVFDGQFPTTAVLVAKRHPDSVKNIIEVVNSMTDANGNKYNLCAKTWSDLGLQDI